MPLSYDQRLLLRECSKDDQAYQKLAALFESQVGQDAQDAEVRMLRSILDAIPDRVYVKDRQSRFILANRATWLAHNMPDEQTLLGKTDIDLFGDGGQAYLDAEQYLLETGISITNLEAQQPNPTSWYPHPYATISKVPLHDEHGQIIGLIGVNRDVTEFKRVAEELRQNQQFSVQVTLAIPDIIYVYDLDEDAVIYCNDQIATHLGYTPEQVYAMGSQFLPTLLHPQDWLRHRDLENRYLRAQDSDVIDFEHRMQHADGTWRWLLHREMIFKRSSDGKPVQIMGIANDITERKRAEEALRQSEAQKNALLNAIPDMIIELDVDGVVLNYKSRAGLIPKFRPSEYVGKHLLDIYPSELVESIMILSRRALTTGQMQILDYESPLVTENTFREARIIAIDHARVLLISRDVTEHRAIQQAQLERERLQVNLQKEQELHQLKSRMMARISHEFRTPLSVIMASNELLWHYMERMSLTQRQDHFQRVQDEVQNVTEILKSISFILHTQTQQHSLEMKACDLKRICEDTLQHLLEHRGSQHPIQLIAEGDLRLLPAEEHLIQRMISHLVSNAIKFSAIESPICLELQRQGQEIMLRLSDQGIGIPERDQPRLYEPFFRGSNVGESSGMGLGLTLIKHVVELHNGRIVIDSAVERGTTVTIHLPTTA